MTPIWGKDCGGRKKGGEDTANRTKEMQHIEGKGDQIEILFTFSAGVGPLHHHHGKESSTLVRCRLPYFSKSRVIKSRDKKKTYLLTHALVHSLGDQNFSGRQGVS